MATLLLVAPAFLYGATPSTQDSNTRPLAIVPLKLSGGIPKVEVQMGDVKATVRLDTGAYDFGISVTPDDLSRMHVRYTGTRHWTDAQGTALEGRSFVVPELRAGSLVVHEVSGSEMVFAKDYAPPDRDGMLGLSFLRNYTLVVDVHDSQLRLYGPAGQLPTECGRRVAPLDADASGISSVLTTSDLRLRLGWDTAASDTYVNPVALKIDPSQFTPGEERTLRGVLLGNIKIDALALRVVPLPVPGIDGLLGEDFFRRHLVCFAFQRQLVAVTGIPHAVEP